VADAHCAPGLERAWQQLTAAQRQEPQLVLAYAEQLRQVGAQGEAEQVLRTALKRNYESHLARLYGLVRGDDRRVSCRPPKAG
jgi:HemY protein